MGNYNEIILYSQSNRALVGFLTGELLHVTHTVKAQLIDGTKEQNEDKSGSNIGDKGDSAVALSQNQVL